MNSHWIFGPRAAAQALAFTLALQMAGSPAAGQSLPTSLKIVVVQGEGIAGRVRQRAAQNPAVRIVDENEKPISGAAVVFTLPTEGATGVFAGGAKTFTIVTDAEGVAVAQGLRFNQIPGKVPVHVNASYKGLMARASITQIVEAPDGYKPGGGGGSGKIIAILAILGAGGAGGAFYAMHKSGSTPSAVPAGPPAIGITPGAGTLSPPR